MLLGRQVSTVHRLDSLFPPPLFELVVDDDILHVVRPDPPVPACGALDVVVDQQILQHFPPLEALRQFVE